MNKKKYNGARVAAGKSISDMCRILGIKSEKTYYTKLSNDSFTIRDVKIICKALKITSAKEQAEIFLT